MMILSRLKSKKAVFERLKQDWDFRRFLLGGIAKVKVEWGIVSMAHNIAIGKAHSCY
jgi:hypothetical protein